MAPIDPSVRAEVAELYARYNWAIDSSDGDVFADTFAADGVFIGSRSEMRGRDALRAFAVGERLKLRGLQHWNANIVIDRCEGDRVLSRAYMMALVPSGTGLIVERAGSYADIIERGEAGWRFTERRFTPVRAAEPVQ